MKRSLVVGFVIQDPQKVAKWYFETIEKTSAIKNIVCHFLIFNKISAPVQKKSFAFRLFEKFENWWFASSDDAAAQVDIGHLLTSANSTIINSQSFFIEDSTVYKQLTQKQLDIIYSVDFNNEEENISSLANFGLWHIKFGYGKYVGFPFPPFWEVMDDSPVLGSYLLSRQNGIDKTIYEGTTSIIPHSVKNSFNSIAWKSSSYMPYRVEGLLSECEQFLSNYSRSAPESILRNETPGNFQMLFLGLRNFFRYLVYKLGKIKEKKFTLLIGYDQFEINGTLKVKPLPLPAGSFFADPFVITRDDTHYIFFEEFISSKKKAHISVIEIMPDKTKSLPKIVLDKPYHLSYPFVFFYEDNYYMIPETSSNKTVELYKAKNFPYEWELVMYLIEDKTLIDVTLHFENGLWWMFANSSNHPFVSSNDQLFLFYSENLFSNDWKSHPQNPVVTQINNCRSAGRLFRQNGKLYRPAQNNASKQYGYGLKINEVILLNEHLFEEKEVYAFDNEKLNLEACHHIDVSANIIVIDGIPNKPTQVK